MTEIEQLQARHDRALALIEQLATLPKMVLRHIETEEGLQRGIKPGVYVLGAKAEELLNKLVALRLRDGIR